MDNTEKETKCGHRLWDVKGFKRVLYVFVFLIILLVVIPLLYYYVIPRFEIRVTTMYHEEIVFGGVGHIKVAVNIENTGTIVLDEVTVDINVVNDTRALRGHKIENFKSVHAGESVALSVDFSGSHYKDYYITIYLNVSYGSETKRTLITHSVIDSKNNAMNIEWTDYLR